MRSTPKPLTGARLRAYEGRRDLGAELLRSIRQMKAGKVSRVATGKELTMERGSGNAFLDLGFDKSVAETLKLRSELTMRIDDWVKSSGLTKAAAAKGLGLTQPRLNALLKGKIGLFSLDALVNVASRAGLQVRLVVKKAG